MTATAANATRAHGFLAPYPGLRPFFQEDAPRFFGRGRQINELLEGLEDRHFLAVVGSSGCGKSSLVHAGMLPALESGWLIGALPKWKIVTLRPGEAPLGNLAYALHQMLGKSSDADDKQAEILGPSLALDTLKNGRFGLLEYIAHAQLDGETNVLVLIDQFEEIFRYRQKDGIAREGDHTRQSPYERHNEAIAFVKLLLSSAEDPRHRVYVVITMRSDFLGECDVFQGLPEAVNRSQFLTPRMTRDQLREAITGPLELFEADADPGLVDRILNDVGSDSDQLPLMQLALLRTWRVACSSRPSDSTEPIKLKVEHYTSGKVGGIAEALDRHGEEAFETVAERLRKLSRTAPAKQERSASDRSWPEPAHKRRSKGQPDEEVAAPPGYSLVDPFRRGSQQILTEFSRAIGIPPDPRQRICERMFRTLSYWTASGRVVRRLATVQEIADVAGVEVADVIPIAEVFLEDDRSFLTTSSTGPLTGETTLDVTHEALFRNWGRLKGWIKSERESAEIYRRLAQTTALYRKGEASLWRKDDFLPVERWFAREQPTARWAERYVTPGDDLASFEESRNFLKRSQNRASFWILVKWLGFIGTVLLAFYLWHLNENLSEAKGKAERNQKEADKQRVIAEENQRKAEASAITAGEQRQIAVEKALEAKTYAKTADEQRAIAVENERKAKASAKTADEQRAIAVEKAKEAVKQQKAAETVGYVGTIRQADSELRAAHGKRARFLLDHAEPKSLRGWEWNYIDRLMHQETRTLPRHTAQVSSLSFNEDGTLLASASVDGTVKLWNSADGAERTILKQGDGESAYVAFSPVGRRLAWSEGARVVLCDSKGSGWQEQERTSRLLEKDDRRKIWALAFSREGTYLATAGEVSSGQEPAVTLWNTGDGTTAKVLTRPKVDVPFNDVRSIAFSRDGAWLASAGWDYQAALWKFTPPIRGRGDLNARDPIVFRRGVWVRCVALSADGKFLATAGNDQVVTLWSLAKGNIHAELKGHSGSVRAVAFSSDSKWLASAGDEGTIKIWDTAKKSEAANLVGHSAGVGTIAFCQQLGLLASGDGVGAIKLWSERLWTDGGAKRDTARHSDVVQAITISPDGKRVVSTSYNSIKVWNADDVNENKMRLPGYAAWVNCASFSPDGKFLAIGTEDAKIHIWDASNSSKWSEMQALRGDGHTNTVRRVVFSPDSRWLASVSWDQSLKIWEVSAGELLKSIPFAHDNRIEGLAFARDGKRIATGSDDGKIKIWNTSDWSLIAVLEPVEGGGYVRAVAFSPDCTKLASASWDQTARIWDTASNELIHTLRGHNNWVKDLAFSPDGARLATASADGTAKIWRVEEGDEVFTLKGHEGAINSIRFCCAPDSPPYLVTGSSDATLKIWRTTRSNPPASD